MSDIHHDPHEVMLPAAVADRLAEPDVRRGVLVDTGDVMEVLEFAEAEDGRYILIGTTGDHDAFVVHEDVAHDILKALVNVLL